MENRIWDKTGKYKDGFLKEYRHWILELSFRQHTLYSFIIFSKRDIRKFIELETNELLELKEVMTEIEEVLSDWEDVKPDKFNYMQLGNSLNHLHFHGIPRYKTERIFATRTWIDNKWGSVPRWSDTEEDNNLIQLLKKEIMPRLQKS